MNENQDSITKQTISYEQQLWKKFQQGDEKALSSIYSIYFHQLYDYGYRFTSDAALVEDCIQELFIKLIRNKTNLSLPDSLKAYLFRSLRSLMFDSLEKQKKYSSAEINEKIEFDLEGHAEPTMIRDEETAERNNKLLSAIQQLTPRQREAIFLKYQEGLSYPEIAELLSLSQKATYKLIGRAIHALRSITISALLLSQVLSTINT